MPGPQSAMVKYPFRSVKEHLTRQRHLWDSPALRDPAQERRSPAYSRRKYHSAPMRRQTPIPDPPSRRESLKAGAVPSAS